jgi:short-subunit dehydrogenase involved in D-alanine esterification of teichoic acids
VTKWDDLVKLFAYAGSKLDIVISDAGAYESNILEPSELDVDRETVRLLPPRLHTLDVNLIATIHVLKLAVHSFTKTQSTRVRLF